jgi:eukaryotic-like serine/threonine-protein kinase
MTQIPIDLATALADRYRLERELGQGGMATVYLAEDLKHDRRVAIKVLRPELAAVIGAERFLREIKTIATLQQPHILGLIDSGEVGGSAYYVMPFVEGESLRDRLNRERQLSIADAVRITTEVAGALDYAHRHGVIHRDIKPENILLHDGSALVADFGIALAVSSAGGTRMTETGMSLGTPHYMSPEQAMGEREITARSDIYGLGCVAYEMLTGEPPFTGATAQAIVARVVTESPRPLTAQRHTIPAEVEAAVLTALEKLPADRFATAAEFAEALAGRRTAGRPDRAVAAPAPAMRPSARQVVQLALALLTTAAIGWWVGHRSASRPVPLQASINLPAELRLSTGSDPVADLSPDGTELLLGAEETGGTRRLYLRNINQLNPVPIGGSDGGASGVFSPDGQWVAYADGAAFKKVPAHGGAAVAITAPADANIASIRWASREDFFVTRQDGSLAWLGADGSFRVIARLDTAAGEVTLDVMQGLPGGQALAIAVTSFPFGQLIAVDPRSGKRSTALPTPVQWAAYSSGYLLWVGADNLLYAARFDTGRLKTTSPVQALGASPQVTRGGRPKVAVAANGALAYVPGQPLSLVSVDRTGRMTTMLDRPRSYHNPRVSPDGQRILFDFEENGRDVWLFNLRDTTITRVTFEGGGHDPVWMPNGRQLLYALPRGNRIGVFRRNVDGSGMAESVLVTDASQVSVHTVTPDGRIGIAASTRLGVLDFDLVTIPLTGQGKSETLLGTRYIEDYPALSPDGKWLAYVSDETNRPEVYVRPFVGSGSKVLVSQNGGSEPVWSRSGRELFYRGLGPREQQLIAAAVDARGDFRVLSRTPLFDVADFESAVPHANYDVMPDGQHFVMVRMGRLSEFVYRQHWIEELERSRPGER